MLSLMLASLSVASAAGPRVPESIWMVETTIDDGVLVRHRVLADYTPVLIRQRWSLSLKAPQAREDREIRREFWMFFPVHPGERSGPQFVFRIGPLPDSHGTNRMVLEHATAAYNGLDRSAHAWAAKFRVSGIGQAGWSLETSPAVAAYPTKMVTTDPDVREVFATKLIPSFRVREGVTSLHSRPIEYRINLTGANADEIYRSAGLASVFGHLTTAAKTGESPLVWTWSKLADVVSSEVSRHPLAWVRVTRDDQETIVAGIPDDRPCLRWRMAFEKADRSVVGGTVEIGGS